MKSLFGNLFDNMEKGFDKLSNSMDNMFCNNSTIISGSNVSMSDINGNITINGVNVTEKYGITKAKNIVINNGKIFVMVKKLQMTLQMKIQKPEPLTEIFQSKSKEL